MGRIFRYAGALVGLALLASAPAATAAGSGQYVVVYEQGSSIAAARSITARTGVSIVPITS